MRLPSFLIERCRVENQIKILNSFWSGFTTVNNVDVPFWLYILLRKMAMIAVFIYWEMTLDYVVMTLEEYSVSMDS